MSPDRYPYQQEVMEMFQQLRESVAVARNASGTLVVYLLYRQRFFPLGSPASVARLSLGALAESIALAKQHAEFGSTTLPTTPVEYLQSTLLETEQYYGTPPIEPPPWLKRLEPLRDEERPREQPGADMAEKYVKQYPTWQEDVRTAIQRHDAPRHTVPLARLSLPRSVLHQMLQLPDDWSIKQVSIEEGNVCVYCLTPECLWLDTAHGMPTIAADYQVEERDGRQWRAPVSTLVKQGDYTVGGKFYAEDHRDPALDL